MAIEQSFQMFAAQYDEALRAGADAAMNGLLTRLGQLLPYALLPMVVMVGVLLSLGQLGWGKALSYGLRVALVLWLVVGMAYVPVIRNSVVDDIPNEIASVVNGRGTPITSARQFDVLDQANAHFVATIKAQATGLLNFPTRLTADASRGYVRFWLSAIFYLWMAVRMLTYLVVAGGAALLLCVIFDSTRGWVFQLFGKFCGLCMWQLMAAVLLNITLAGMEVFLRQALSNPGASLDEQLEVAFKIGDWFLGCFVLLLLVPAAAGIGSGYAAGAAQGVAMGLFTGGARLVGGVAVSSGSAVAGALRRIGRTANPHRTASQGSRP